MAHRYFHWSIFGTLQLDSSDPAALERSMRIYNGKPLINSVNGKSESMLCWIIISQWYHLQRLTEWKKERIINENIQTIQTSGITDRIAVKDGSHIHIIHLKDLIYIQACGDYVTLFTSNGEYLKEETMKYLESNLPADKFLRIHRSFIVNLEQIQQVELFGKETYHVLLKNGATLRASNTGYKLLKEQLSL